MTEIGRLPTEALEAAAREMYNSQKRKLRYPAGTFVEDPWASATESERQLAYALVRPPLLAAAPHLIAEGRRQAAEAIRAADTAEWGPKRWLVPDVRDCQESAARIAEGADHE